MKSKYTPGPWWYEIEHLNTFDDDDKCGVVFHDTAITGELHNGGYNPSCVSILSYDKTIMVELEPNGLVTADGFAHRA